MQPAPPFGIPKHSEEYWKAAAIYQQVSFLGIIYVDRFASALKLFDFASAEKAKADARQPWPPSDESKLFSDWRRIAARDAVMTIFHFSEALTSIRANLRTSPTYKAQSNPVALREAGKLIRKHFPQLDLFRHQIAHAGTRLDSDKKKKAATVTGPFYALREGGGACEITPQPKPFALVGADGLRAMVRR